MHARTLVTVALAMMAGFANAQTRKAVITGGGDAARGKCTIEVMVDGAAQVQVRGNTATLRNLKGQAPQWRRFECTSPMPGNPADFRFAGVDGRGRQTLVRDPRNNRGTAVVELEDPDSGAEGYTFDLFWGSGPDYSSGFQGDRGGRNDQRFTPPDNRPGDQGGFRGGRRMTEEEALDVCRRSVRDQAADRFRNPNIDIRNIAIDNNPGRRDWITGDLLIRRRFGRDQVYRFSCSVNFDTGAVRSTHIDQFEQDYYPNRRN